MTMTIEWRYTTQEGLGILSLAGFLGADAVNRFTGAVGWVVARGSGPVILDLTELRGWSVSGRLAVAQACRRLEAEGRRPELAALPADGSADPEGTLLSDGALGPDGSRPEVTVHHDLTAALAAHREVDPAAEIREWRTTAWPGA
ncbi:STAS domain-containing protein [Streptomyces coeruleoprunus]|uniref:STAS domain-containing protein n=1 Tax=Streptomyces coeruleoprunus TaxID=285563 RepID=A0ABV9XKC7_9ACTN